MIYVITWVITNMVSAGCPLLFITDEFGRRYPRDHKYPIHCWEIRSTEMKKEFSDRDSAIAFYSKAYQYEKVDSLRIDSVMVTALHK